jgi:hypothetical protein
MGDYGGQTATELDSHANMAVAGANVSVISKSGLMATVCVLFFPPVTVSGVCEYSTFLGGPSSNG